MMGNLWLSWFATVLAVGVAAALLGRRRALPLGGFGALLWIALSLSDPRTEAARDPLLWIGLVAGAVAIVGISVWVASSTAFDRADGDIGSPIGADINRGEQDWSTVHDALERFEDWLSTNRHRGDPWPDFGEFLRSMLLMTCKARHIRAYRMLSPDDDRLCPLRRTDPEEHEFPSARNGLIGHVLTSGRSYVHGDPTQGSLVDQLARIEEEGTGCAWCFCVRHQDRPVGVVWVGELDTGAVHDRGRMVVIEKIAAMCWSMVAETCRSRLAGYIDPMTGVLTHDAFMAAAAESLEAAYAHGEPVAMATISLEGMRGLADQGRWDIANQLRHEVSTLLKERMRLEDRIGVFDESRYLLLLRRVDSGLAELIVGQLVERLAAVCSELDRAGQGLHVRCGLAGSGMQRPTLRTLVTRSMGSCHEARRAGVDLLSDLQAEREAERT